MLGFHKDIVFEPAVCRDCYQHFQWLCFQRAVLILQPTDIHWPLDGCVLCCWLPFKHATQPISKENVSQCAPHANICCHSSWSTPGTVSCQPCLLWITFRWNCAAWAICDWRNCNVTHIYTEHQNTLNRALSDTHSQAYKLKWKKDN